MTPNDILNKSFDRATVGGYKMDDVNSFMATVAETFKSMSAEQDDLHNKLIVLADRLEEYRNDEESMRSALLGAQKLGDNIIKESKEKAETTLSATSAQAENIIASAQNEANRIENDAKLNLETETYALNKMKREVSRFRKQLLALYQQHITMIEALPEEIEEKDDNAPKLSSPLTSKMGKANSSKTDTSFGEELSESSDTKKEEKDHAFKPMKFGDSFRLNTEE